jgi:[ribosomal protein S5]-alanine N-acetyltransferase
MVTLRQWRQEDCARLAELANNRKIWRNLREPFPYPYTLENAQRWIAYCGAMKGNQAHFAIEADGEVVGATGFTALGNVYRIGAEIGYWIGEPYWGRGIATAALIEASRLAFAGFPFERLQGEVFGWNHASMRVLEKAGYQLEGRHRRSVIKDGEVTDRVIYARLRE